MDDSVHEVLRHGWRTKDEIFQLFPPTLSNPFNSQKEATHCNWEWQKNKAILDLVHQNESLTRLLSLANKDALEWEAQARGKEELLKEGEAAQRQLLLCQTKLQWAQSALQERACALLQLKRSSAALSLWRRYCTLCKRKKVLSRAKRIWSAKVLMKWFGVFQDAILQLRAKRQLLERCLLLEKKRLVCPSFKWWQSWIREKKALQTACRRVVQSINQGVLREFIARWSTVCRNGLQYKAHERKATMVLLRSRLQKVWTRWSAFQQASSNCKDVAEQLYFTRRLSYLFARWKSHTTKRVMKSTWLQCGARQRATTLTSLSFNAWLGMIHKRVLIAERRALFCHRALYRYKKALFKIWLQVAMRNKDKRNFRLLLKSKKERHVKEQVIACLLTQRLQRRLIEKFILTQSSRKRLHTFNGWLWQVTNQQWCRLWTWSKRKHKNIQIKKSTFFAWLLYHEMSRTDAAFGNVQHWEEKFNQSELEFKEWKKLRAESEKLYSSLEVQNPCALEKCQRVVEDGPPLLEATLQWTCLPKEEGFALPARAGHSSVCISCSLGSKVSTYIVVFGGYNGKKCFGDIFLFNTVTKSWRIPVVSAETGSVFPRPSWDHTACAYKNKMIVFGGFDGSLQSSELSILSFSNDVESCSWSQPRYSMGASPAPLSQHTCCLYGEEGRYMVIFGGYNACKGHLNELWILDLHLMSWTSPECFGTPPSSRRGHGAAVIQNKMFVFGGFDGTTHLCDIQVLDLRSFTWEHVLTKGSAPTPRRHHAVEAVGDHLMLYGGYDGVRYLDDMFSLDINTKVWTAWNPLKSQTFTVNNIGGAGTKFARSLHTMTHDRNKLVVIGGVHGNDSLQDVLFLESAAAVQGTQVKSLLFEEMAKGSQLQKKVQGCEELLEKRSRELVTLVSRTARLEHSLKEAQEQRAVLIGKNKLLKRKLEKARTTLMNLAD